MIRTREPSREEADDRTNGHRVLALRMSHFNVPERKLSTTLARVEGVDRRNAGELRKIELRSRAERSVLPHSSDCVVRVRCEGYEGALNVSVEACGGECTSGEYLQIIIARGRVVSLVPDVLSLVPLFFCFDGEWLYVFKSLTCFEAITGRRVRKNELFDLVALCQLEALTPVTPFKDVHVIPAGQRLVREGRCWRLVDVKLEPMIEAPAGACPISAVSGAVLLALERCADDSILAFSGGLDSTLLVLLSCTGTKSRDFPLVHVLGRENLVDGDYSNAVRIAELCDRPLHVLDPMERRESVRFEASRSVQLPSVDGLVPRHSEFLIEAIGDGPRIGGHGGDQMFMSRPTLSELGLASAASMRELLYILAVSSDRFPAYVYESIVCPNEGERSIRNYIDLRVQWPIVAMGRTSAAVEDSRSLIRVGARVLRNFLSVGGTRHYWWRVLNAASVQKSGNFQLRSQPISPLLDWSVVLQVSSVDQRRLNFPRLRNFERELIEASASRKAFSPELSRAVRAVCSQVGKATNTNFLNNLFHQNRDVIERVVDKYLGCNRYIDEEVFRRKLFGENVFRPRGELLNFLFLSLHNEAFFDGVESRG